MSVRFTKRGAFLIYRDEANRKWKSTEGISLSWLRQSVTSDPGVTVSTVLGAVQSSPELSRFLTEFTGCNLDELHSRDRTPAGELLVTSGATKVDGNWVFHDSVPAEVLTIKPVISICEDEIGDQRHSVNFMALVSSYININCGTSLGYKAPDHFGDICQLHVRVKTKTFIDRCESDDDDWPEDAGDGEESDDADAVVAEVTLLDFLGALYGMFGKPKYSTYDAKYHEEIDELIDRFNAENEDDADWWKKEGTEDE